MVRGRLWRGGGCGEGEGVERGSVVRGRVW